MPQIEVDDETDRYLAFAAGIAGLTKGQVVARLVAQIQATAKGSPSAEDEDGPASVRIYADYAGHRTYAAFVPGPGRIEITSGPLAGRAFRTPSEAAREIVKHYKPDVNPHRNGWGFFFVAATGAPLQSLRHRSAWGAAMRLPVFIDETKERDFLMLAVYISQPGLSKARRAINRLILPGQRSIHFCKEKDERRRQVLAAVRGLAVEAIAYDAKAYRSGKAARDACLKALVTDAGKADAERIVIEVDDSNIHADKALLNQRLRMEGLTGRLRYDHLRAHEECLLAIPDALAWSWAKGGEWRAAVRPIVKDVRQL